MIKLLGKAKLHTIEVQDYLQNITLIRNLTENLIGLNQTAEIQVYSDHLIIEGKLSEQSETFLNNHYELTEIEVNKYKLVGS